jgi:hypothetical protein
MSVLGWSLCDFASVNLPENEIGLMEGRVGFGMFSRDGLRSELPWSHHQSDHSYYSDDHFICVPYRQAEKDALFDAAWRAGGAMAIISSILGFLAMVLALSATCIQFEPAFFKALGVLLMASGLFSALSFVWFVTDVCSKYDCEYSVEAGLTTGACIFFLISGICSMFITPPSRGECASNYPSDVAPMEGPEMVPVAGQPGTVTVTEMEMPDGTKKIVKTTVNADMSKTVEETVIQSTDGPA